jgi:hypothetical protein
MLPPLPDVRQPRRMALGAPLCGVLSFEKLSMVDRQRSRREDFVAPRPAEPHHGGAQGRQRDAENESPAFLAQGADRLAAVADATLTVWRGTFLARAATERRSIAMPTIAVAHRMACRRRGTAALRRRSGGACRAVSRETADPTLLRPLVLVGRRWAQLSHGSPP